MIVLIGESAGGKSTLETIISNDYGYNKIISHTTRPMRKGEISGEAYHFVSEEQFDILKSNNAFAEFTKYREWQYGILSDNCQDNKSVVVVEPTGYRQIQTHKNLKPMAFHINVDIRERLIRLIRRGDDLMECFRRIFSDQGAFNGIENLVDFIVDNEKREPEVIAKAIVTLYEGVMTT